MSGIENSGKGDPKCNQEGTFPVVIDEQTARVPDHGVGSHGIQKQTPHRQSKRQQILDNIKVPRLSAAEVSRLIAIEIVLIIQEMRTCEGDDDAAALKLKNFIGQIRALRAVAEVAKVADVWSKRDVVLFDGPGFNFVLGEIASYCEEAASTALRGDNTAVNSIMRELHDIIGVRRTELRSYCTGEDRQSLEAEPTDRWTSEPATENDAPAQAMAHHNEHKDHSEPENESEAEKNLKHPETSPTVPMTSKSRTQNGAGDTATEHNNERNDHSEPESESGANENLKRPETSLTFPSLHKQETKNAAVDKATAHRDEHNDHSEPEKEIEADEHPQRPKTPSSVRLPRNPTTENGAPYTLTPHRDERSDHSEPEDDTLPFEDLLESEADRATAKEVRKSIIKHEESD
jgi:hypothetical protein